MTADRLQSIKARAAAASDPEFWSDFYNTTFSTEVDSPTAEFIGNSRADVDWLVGEVERLREPGVIADAVARVTPCTCSAARADRDALQARLDAVEAALATHPEVCDQYADEDAITCGWKRAVEDITAAIRRKR